MAGRELPTRTPDLDAFNAFMADFAQESDRAAVIVGVAKVDLVLFQILQRVLAPSTSGTDELLENNGPLSTFSSRIHLVYRLGLVDDHFARALHLVRKIRNTFAHEAAKGSLDQPPHQDRIRELAAPFAQYDKFQADVAKMSGTGSASKQFRLVLATMAVRLEQLLVSSVRCHPSVSQTLVPPHWDDPEPTEGEQVA